MKCIAQFFLQKRSLSFVNTMPATSASSTSLASPPLSAKASPPTLPAESQLTFSWHQMLLKVENPSNLDRKPLSCPEHMTSTPATSTPRWWRLPRHLFTHDPDKNKIRWLPLLHLLHLFTYDKNKIRGLPGEEQENWGAGFRCLGLLSPLPLSSAIFPHHSLTHPSPPTALDARKPELLTFSPTA